MKKIKLKNAQREALLFIGNANKNDILPAKELGELMKLGLVEMQPADGRISLTERGVSIYKELTAEQA